MNHREPLAMRVFALGPLSWVVLTAMVLQLAAPDFTVAADGGWRDFFGMGTDDPEPTVYDDELLLADPATESLDQDENDAWMINSPFANVTWPEIKMPRFEFNPPWKGDGENPSWLAGSLAKARSTAHGAAARTRSAWNNTVERMKFALPGRSDDTTTQLAEQQEPGFWQRMLSPPEPTTEPDDVVEMMAREPSTMQR